MKFRWIAVVMAFMVLTLVIPRPASAEFFIGEAEGVKVWMAVHTVGAWQALDQNNNTNSLSDLSTGLHTAFGNIAWRATFDEYVEMYWDATMASRVHNDRWWGHEGWMIVHQVPEGSPVAFLRPLFTQVKLKAGHFDIAFGNELMRKSINADVQRNPLIGNFLVTPMATEPGVEIISKDHWPVKWLVGAGIGDSTENFDNDRGYSFHAKVWGDVLPNLSWAFSFYTLDSSDLAPSHGSGPGHLFSSERIGGRYAAVWGGGSAPGQMLLGEGFDETDWVFDVTWEPTPQTTVNALWGSAQDDDPNGLGGSNGTPEDDWTYYGGDVTHYLTESVYLAGRYSVADADTVRGDSTNDGEVERIQLGVGAWLTERTLLKVEWVDQEASGFQTGTTQFTGTDLGLDPEFDGLIAELSVSL